MAAALASAAAPPGVIAWAASASQAKSPLEIKVGQTEALSHIEFRWAGGARYQARRAGQTLTLHFERLADPDMSLLRVDPPAFLQSAELRKAKGAIDVVLTLKPGADAKTGQADGAIFVNLFPAKPADAAPAPAPEPVAATDAPRPDPRPANGVVRLKGEIASGQILLHFPWRNPLGAAAFRRGDGVWLVFDTPGQARPRRRPAANADLQGNQGRVRPRLQRGARQFAGRRRPSGPGRTASTWTLAIGPGLQPWPVGIKTERDAAAPLPTLQGPGGGRHQGGVDRRSGGGRPHRRGDRPVARQGPGRAARLHRSESAALGPRPGL